jgi:protein associated with RNAse G/E
MDIFDATLKLKDHVYNGNNQIVRIGDNLEVSGFSPIPILHFFQKKINYEKDTKIVSWGNFFYLMILNKFVLEENLLKNII